MGITRFWSLALVLTAVALLGLLDLGMRLWLGAAAP